MIDNIDANKMYSTKEVAQLFGISSKTLERGRKTGDKESSTYLPYYMVGQRAKYQGSDIIDHLIKIRNPK